MAKKNTAQNLLMFLGVTAVCVAIGYGLGLLSMWVYESYLKEVSLGFGESILLLGGLACAVYTITGAGIAFAYQKFMK